MSGDEQLSTTSDSSPAGSPAARVSTVQGGWPALEEVLRYLDAEVLRIVCGPRDRATAVSDVVILDPTDPQSAQAGGILLGVGLAPSAGDALAIVDRAARCGAAAVVFRTGEELPAQLVTIAESVDTLGLLAVPPEMAWGQLYSLMRTAIVSAGSVAGPNQAGVPVGDLFALADAIAAAVGGPVTIEDPQWRLLAYSNLDYAIDDARRETILGRTPPDVWQRRLEKAGVARALRSGAGVIRFQGFEGEALARRLAAPVWAGSELVGSIWVAEAGESLGADAERELARTAQLAAIHLISHHASEDVRRRTRGAFMREALEGRIAASGGELPLRAEGPFSVLGFEHVSGESAARTGDAERILSIMALYCEDVNRDAMCGLVGERFWALVPVREAGARERTLELACKILDRVERAVHVQLSAGIGISVGRISEVPRSRRTAEHALKLLAQRPGAPRPLHIEDVRAHAVLLELLDLAAEHPTLLDGKTSAVLDHDRERGTRYAATLRAYLECWGDAARAAERLGVHPNTARYRVRQISERFGLDLDDADERFAVEFQLRLFAHRPPRDDCQ